MDRRQRRISEEPFFREGTGEWNTHSQAACDPMPRLALTPCRVEEMTEHGQWSQCRKTLQSVCAKKECSLKEVGPVLSQSLEVISDGIFPLPLPERLGWCLDVSPTLELLG